MLKSNNAPVDVLCYRPSDFRSMQQQHQALKIGLSNSKHLEFAAVKPGMTLTTRLEEMKLLIESHGFDTFIQVLVEGKEHYLPEQWGDVTLSQVENFVSELERTGDKYDKENLILDGLACRESLHPDLFARVSSLTSASTSGSVYLKTATDQVLFMNALPFAISATPSVALDLMMWKERRCLCCP